MWKKERYQRISRILDDLGHVRTDQLIDDLDVSRETIRRDLLDMEGLGLLHRVHGGATIHKDVDEPPLSVRQSLNVKEKLAIAKAAAGMITHQKVVFFDAGSTTIQLAQQLAGVHNLHLITNSIDAAQILHDLGDGSSRVTLLGGNLSPFGFATSGSQTIRQIGRIIADLAFVSPAAIDPKLGAMSAAEEEADIALAMLANSREHIVMADAAKFSTHGHFSYCPYAHMEVLITDGNIRKEPGLEDSLRAKINTLVVA
jgi:DeoR/GlpR family transcriptional regulator of sugar metabolism